MHFLNGAKRYWHVRTTSADPNHDIPNATQHTYKPKAIRLHSLATLFFLFAICLIWLEILLKETIKPTEWITGRTAAGATNTQRPQKRLETCPASAAASSSLASLDEKHSDLCSTYSASYKPFTTDLSPSLATKFDSWLAAYSSMEAESDALQDCGASATASSSLSSLLDSLTSLSTTATSSPLTSSSDTISSTSDSSTSASPSATSSTPSSTTDSTSSSTTSSSLSTTETTSSSSSTTTPIVTSTTSSSTSESSTSSTSSSESSTSVSSTSSETSTSSSITSDLVTSMSSNSTTIESTTSPITTNEPIISNTTSAIPVTPAVTSTSTSETPTITPTSQVSNVTTTSAAPTPTDCTELYAQCSGCDASACYCAPAAFRRFWKRQNTYYCAPVDPCKCRLDSETGYYDCVDSDSATDYCSTASTSITSSTTAQNATITSPPITSTAEPTCAGVSQACGVSSLGFTDSPDCCSGYTCDLTVLSCFPPPTSTSDTTSDPVITTTSSSTTINYPITNSSEPITTTTPPVTTCAGVSQACGVSSLGFTNSPDCCSGYSCDLTVLSCFPTTTSTSDPITTTSEPITTTTTTEAPVYDFSNSTSTTSPIITSNTTTSDPELPTTCGGPSSRCTATTLYISSTKYSVTGCCDGQTCDSGLCFPTSTDPITSTQAPYANGTTSTVDPVITTMPPTNETISTTDSSSNVTTSTEAPFANVTTTQEPSNITTTSAPDNSSANATTTPDEAIYPNTTASTFNNATITDAPIYQNTTTAHNATVTDTPPYDNGTTTSKDTVTATPPYATTTTISNDTVTDPSNSTTPECTSEGKTCTSCEADLCTCQMAILKRQENDSSPYSCGVDPCHCQQSEDGTWTCGDFDICEDQCSGPYSDGGPCDYGQDSCTTDDCSCVMGVCFNNNNESEGESEECQYTGDTCYSCGEDRCVCDSQGSEPLPKRGYRSLWWPSKRDLVCDIDYCHCQWSSEDSMYTCGEFDICDNPCSGPYSEGETCDDCDGSDCTCSSGSCVPPVPQDACGAVDNSCDNCPAMMCTCAGPEQSDGNNTCIADPCHCDYDDVNEYWVCYEDEDFCASNTTTTDPPYSNSTTTNSTSTYTAPTATCTYYDTMECVGDCDPDVCSCGTVNTTNPDGTSSSNYQCNVSSCECQQDANHIFYCGDFDICAYPCSGPYSEGNQCYYGDGECDTSNCVCSSGTCINSNATVTDTAQNNTCTDVGATCSTCEATYCVCGYPADSSDSDSEPTCVVDSCHCTEDVEARSWTCSDVSTCDNPCSDPSADGESYSTCDSDDCVCQEGVCVTDYSYTFNSCQCRNVGDECDGCLTGVCECAYTDDSETLQCLDNLDNGSSGEEGSSSDDSDGGDYVTLTTPTTSSDPPAKSCTSGCEYCGYAYCRCWSDGSCAADPCFCEEDENGDTVCGDEDMCAETTAAATSTAYGTPAAGTPSDDGTPADTPDATPAMTLTTPSDADGTPSADYASAAASTAYQYAAATSDDSYAAASTTTSYAEPTVELTTDAESIYYADATDSDAAAAAAAATTATGGPACDAHVTLRCSGCRSTDDSEDGCYCNEDGTCQQAPCTNCQISSDGTYMVCPEGYDCQQDTAPIPKRDVVPRMSNATDVFRDGVAHLKHHLQARTKGRVSSTPKVRAAPKPRSERRAFQNTFDMDANHTDARKRDQVSNHLQAHAFADHNRSPRVRNIWGVMDKRDGVEVLAPGYVDPVVDAWNYLLWTTPLTVRRTSGSIVTTTVAATFTLDVFPDGSTSYPSLTSTPPLATIPITPACIPATLIRPTGGLVKRGDGRSIAGTSAYVSRDASTVTVGIRDNYLVMTSNVPTITQGVATAQALQDDNNANTNNNNNNDNNANNAGTAAANNNNNNNNAAGTAAANNNNNNNNNGNGVGTIATNGGNAAGTLSLAKGYADVAMTTQTMQIQSIGPDGSRTTQAVVVVKPDTSGGNGGNSGSSSSSGNSGTGSGSGSSFNLDPNSNSGSNAGYGTGSGSNSGSGSGSGSGNGSGSGYGSSPGSGSNSASGSGSGSGASNNGGGGGSGGGGSNGADGAGEPFSNQERVVNIRPFTMGSYIGALYLPTIMAVLVKILFETMVASFKMMEPFERLHRSKGATAEDSLCSQYLSSSLSSDVFTSIWNGRSIPLWTLLIYILISVGAPLSSASMTVKPMDTCFLHGAYRLCDPAWIVNVQFIRIMEALLAACLLVTIILAYDSWHYHAGVPTNPTSIAAVAVLLNYEPLRHDLQSVEPEATEEETAKALQDYHFWLIPHNPSRTQLRYGIVHAPKRNESSARDLPEPGFIETIKTKYSRYTGYLTGETKSSVIPHFTSKQISRYADYCHIFTTATLLILLVTYYIDRRPDAFNRFFTTTKSIWPKFILVSLASVVDMQWKNLEREVRILEPYRRLSYGNARPENTILCALNGTCWSNFPGCFVNLFKFRYMWFEFIIGVTAILSDVNIIAVSGVLWNVSQTEAAFMWSNVTGIACTSIMAINLAITVLWWRRNPTITTMPRNPETVAVVLSYICSSRMAADFASWGMENVSEFERDQVIIGKGRRYRFAKLVGEDGLERWCVDYDEGHGEFVGEYMGKDMDRESWIRRNRERPTAVRMSG